MRAGHDVTPPTDWIDASRQGSREAFTRIIERHHRAVYAVAFSGVRDHALADDITQDTFVVAWRRLGELRDPDRLPAWLCGIARNLARDARKRRHRETPGSDEAIELTDPATPYEALTAAESERVVAVGLEQVPDVYREPLVLFYYQDRSVEDVSRALGISPATTNKRLSRGRRYLAERVANLVEHGTTLRGPSPTLVASVLAAIALVAPASHVDASTAPVKGSTMSKLAIAAVITASLGGAGLLAATTMRGGDAHAGTDGKAPAAQGPRATATPTAEPPASCALDALRDRIAAGAHGHAPGVPRLASHGSAAQATTAANDCAAVGRHLAELEADTTHGPTHRPDEETCERCAAHYSAQCESQGWSAERRNCSLAAADLINAHLCAGGVASGSTEVAEPELQCAALASHMATTIQGAGLYTEVTDMAQQVEAACVLGGWPTELRQCLAQASSIAALQACVAPPAE
jgi:RNA polymerase sigma factor (sigma-70 family)